MITYIFLELWHATRRSRRAHPPGNPAERFWRYLDLNQPMYVQVKTILRLRMRKKNWKTDHVIEKSNFLGSKIVQLLIAQKFWIDSIPSRLFFSPGDFFSLHYKNCKMQETNCKMQEKNGKKKEKKSPRLRNGDKGRHKTVDQST